MKPKLHTLPEKMCTKCKEIKPMGEFRIRYKTRKDGYRHLYRNSSCLSCEKLYSQESKTSRNSHRRLRIETIVAYGGHCGCCGESRMETLDLDHVHNDGNKHRRGGETANTLYARLRREGYPKGDFQVLCRNCNWLKHLYGECPHKGDLYSRFVTGNTMSIGELYG